MGVLKRFEVWVLLALVAGGLFFVFTQQGSRDGALQPGKEEKPEEKTGGPSSATISPLKLQSIVIERDGDHAVLDLAVRYENQSSGPLDLRPPESRLLAAEGEEIPEFILPFAPSPVVPADSEAEVSLQFWLPVSRLEGSLELDVAGDRLLVKSPAPFPTDTLKQGERLTFDSPDWDR